MQAYLFPQEPGVSEQRNTYPHTTLALGPSQRSLHRAGVGAAMVAPMMAPLADNATSIEEFDGDPPTA